jgi:hypothetical protein
MVFDVGNGLAAAGAAMGKTLGDMNLEAQKADLENQKIMLADQLAGAREEKQRQFTTSERRETQTFQSGENALTRTNQKDIATIGANATVQAAGIHAGATLQAATLAAKAHLEGVQKEIDALAPTREVDVQSKKIANQTQQQLLDARNGYVSALESGDIDAQTKAIQKMAGIEFNPKDQYTEASLYQQQARLFEQAMTSAQTKLATLQANPTTAMTDQGKVAIDALTRQVQYLQGQFNTSVRAAQDALSRVPNYGGRGGTPGTARPPLASFGATPGAQPSSTPGPGIINMPPPAGGQ